MITELDVMKEGWKSMGEFKLDILIGLFLFLLLVTFWGFVIYLVWPIVWYCFGAVSPILKAFWT